MIRATWEEYFMNIATEVATRSTCIRRQIGAVIVKDKRILTTGYNGSVHGAEHCSDNGVCLKGNAPSGTGHDICNAVHAEQNAIIQAALHGVALKGAEIYVTTPPCSLCAKMIVQAGVTRVIYKGTYPDKRSLEILKRAGIKIVNLDEVEYV